MSGTDYRKKRTFDRTPEPSGGGNPHKQDGFFVIHKHDASTLHYDFRLAVAGTLKSWAVPKGPSTDPSEKRLAIRTEDHPLEYADFEGVIPEGEYGAGTVLIWDRGPFENITVKDGETIKPEDSIENGHFLFRLHGENITGGYALQRMGDSDDGQWLLVKMDDDEADARRNPVSTQPKSVESGRDLDEIAASEDSEE